jgi:hypothetical protein
MAAVTPVAVNWQVTEKVGGQEFEVPIDREFGEAIRQVE